MILTRADSKVNEKWMRISVLFW